MNRIGKVTAGALLSALFLSPLAVKAYDLGGLFKKGVIGVGTFALVQKFGPEIDKQLDKTLDLPPAQTKVVPIVTAGSGTYAGACQVQGPTAAIKQVRAVAQVAVKVGAVRAQGLIPVSTMNPGKSPQRIEGVGVSAIVDIKL